MELSDRKRAVLAAVIKAYIKTGEPVGSKILTTLLENAPSSATLRSEMSELCELGLLKQPHTSAGRVPTKSGYDLYIKKLMRPEALDENAKGIINAGLSKIYCEPEKIPAEAADIYSKLSGFPVVSSFISSGDTVIRRIELFPVGSNTAMLLLLTSDGRSRNRMFRFSSGLTDGLRDRFFEIVREKIRGKPLNTLTKAYMQGVAAAAGIDALALMPFFTTIFEMADDIDESIVNIAGADMLHSIYGTKAAGDIMSLVDRKNPILRTLEMIDEKSGVIFGADTEYKELSSSTIVAAGWSAGGSYRGSIGIIGPSRMAYEQIIPGTEYIADRLTEIMARALKDMEE